MVIRKVTPTSEVTATTIGSRLATITKDTTEVAAMVTVTAIKLLQKL